MHNRICENINLYCVATVLKPWGYWRIANV